MASRLGKTFNLDVTSQVPAPDLPPPGKTYVEETIVGVDGETLNLTLPASDPATAHRLTEIRVYLVPHDQPRLESSEAYEASAYPFGTFAVDDAMFASGGPVAITLPAVDRLVPHFGQNVLFDE